MDFMSVENRNELLDSTDAAGWTVGDQIAYVERVIELELTGSPRTPFEWMQALHELDDIRTAIYRRGAPKLLFMPENLPVNENLERFGHSKLGASSS